MCVLQFRACVCVFVCLLQHVCETYIDAQAAYVEAALVFSCVCEDSSFVRRFLQHGARSPPRPPYGHLETLICAVHACVCVCLAGHEQCADDVKSPWVAFRRSPARSGNHPVYGPYVKTAQRRAHASSEDVTRARTHTHICHFSHSLK